MYPYDELVIAKDLGIAVGFQDNIFKTNVSCSQSIEKRRLITSKHSQSCHFPKYRRVGFSYILL
ncbi:hypothetical protein PWYN_04535 [Paenibacillus wynnii]|uniref:Uncharacterized protein n=1 Tax=Paenibacillus wynnii TaxID=268407 RepID=A0A098MB07_9BACL|nr:hypothetical protein PWYN_04535 [Paenibacillus wynnii]